ncbi:MAG: glycosyltransferase [Actinomycetota bacterium]
MTVLRTRPRRDTGPGWQPQEPDEQTVEAAQPARDAEFRPWRPSRRLRALLLANFGMASFYLTWWLAPGHAGTPILFYLLAAAEAFNLLHLFGLWWAIWSTKVDPPPKHRTHFSVDVFIPTYGEPLHVLARTIRATVAMDVAHTTYVLDDANSADVKLLAERLGAAYIARTSNKGAKAGNLNNALAQTDGEVFAIFDADHVPRKDFLKRILGYFEDPQVAFVQTPQYYGNSSENEVARNAYQQQAIFYGPIMRGKNGMGAAFCCGTNVIFRRTALDEVGGFDQKSVVEDFVTSMRIHRRGWRSVYYPYILAEGLGPSSLRDYFRQQFRWARGSVGSLLSLEPFKPGLTIGQRFQYFLASTWYLIGLVTIVYMMLPILYLLGGWSPFSNTSGSFLLFYCPYVLLALITIRWGLGHQLRFEHLRYTFGCFAVYAAAAVASILHLPARFQVTGKHEGRTERPPLLAGVVAFSFVALIVSMIVGLFLRPIGARTITNISWGVVNLLLLSGIVGAAVREMRAHRDPVSARRRETFRQARSLRPIAGGASTIAEGRRLVLPEYAVKPDMPQASTGRSTPPALQVGVVTLLGLALRVAMINVPGLRADESLSLAQVQTHSLTGLWKYLITGNVHVPLYHTILHFWIGFFGDSEWALRVPSVVFGTAAIPLLYIVARRLVGSRAAVVAATIGAASPFWVWHSDEARMYPLLLMLVLASMALLFEAVDKGKLWRWTAYALVTGLSLYSHYFALLMPPVHFAYLMVNRVGRKKLLAWLGAMLAVGAMFLPWMVWLYTARIHTHGVASLTNGVRITQTYSVYSVISAFLIFFVVFVIGYHATPVFTLLSGFALGTWPLAAHFTVVGRRIVSRLRSRTTAFLLSWLALTVGAVFVLNLWKSGLWYQKYLIMASPPVFLLLSRGLSRFVGKRVLGAVVLFSVLAGISVAGNFESASPVQEDFRQVAAVMRTEAGPADALFVMPAFEATPMRYYLNSYYTVYAYDRPAKAITHDFLPYVIRDHRNASLWVVTDSLYAGQADVEGSPKVLHFLRTRFISSGSCEFGRLSVSRFGLGNDVLPLRNQGSSMSCAAGVSLLTAGPAMTFSPALAWFMVAINALVLIVLVGGWLMRRRAYRRDLPPDGMRSSPVQRNGGSNARGLRADVARSRTVGPNPLQIRRNSNDRAKVEGNSGPQPVVSPPVSGAQASGGRLDGEEVFARLSDPDPFLRITAIAALKGRPDCDTLLVRALSDEYPLVRREAVRALRGIGSQRATEALIQVAGHDPSAEVREEAVAALGALVKERHTDRF